MLSSALLSYVFTFFYSDNRRRLRKTFFLHNFRFIIFCFVCNTVFFFAANYIFYHFSNFLFYYFFLFFYLTYSFTPYFFLLQTSHLYNFIGLYNTQCHHSHHRHQHNHHHHHLFRGKSLPEYPVKI